MREEFRYSVFLRLKLALRAAEGGPHFCFGDHNRHQYRAKLQRWCVENQRRAGGCCLAGMAKPCLTLTTAPRHGAPMTELPPGTQLTVETEPRSEDIKFSRSLSVRVQCSHHRHIRWTASRRVRTRPRWVSHCGCPRLDLGRNLLLALSLCSRRCAWSRSRHCINASSRKGSQIAELSADSP